MKKSQLILLLIAGLFVTAAVYVYLGMEREEVTAPVTEVQGEPAVTIVRTSSGYEPSEVTIKKGDIILWKNESDEFHWPASDLHPTHSIYSEFDPLRPLAVGEDWKFQFNNVGVWNFHDHIRANKVGTITVVE